METSSQPERDLDAELIADCNMKASQPFGYRLVEVDDILAAIRPFPKVRVSA